MRKHMHGGDVYRHQNVIDFSANCNPLGTPQRVKEAIAESSEQVYHYPDVECEELRRALEVYEGIPKEGILCGNGAADLIFSLVLARKPKKALLPAPTFAEYEQALGLSDCEISYYNMEEKNGFIMGEDFLSMITDEMDILFLCNPNNPTGVLLDRTFIKKVLDACHRHHVFFVLDECFVDFVEYPQDYTMKEYLEEFPELFILKAFTKRYAIAGVRLGYGLSRNRLLLERMNEVKQPWNVSTTAQKAGLAALGETEYVKKAMNLVHRERVFLKKALERLGYKVYDSKANYIFFHGPARLQEKCLQQGVLIRDCSNYRGLSDGYYRIAVRTHGENEKLIQTLNNIDR